MKILLTGADGQLAQSLIQNFPDNWQSYAFSAAQLDITDGNQVLNTLKNLQADFIINTAAYNSVDRAAKEINQCLAVNHLAVANLAQISQQLNSKLIHFSTNYVFAGMQSELYLESSITQPINLYGLSKLNGEQAIQNYTDNAIIIRTAALFSPYRTNFPKKIIHQISQNKTISVTNDSYVQPTSCQALALFVIYLIEQDYPNGIIHFSGEEYYSWFNYAQLILKQYRQLHPSLQVNLLDSNDYLSQNQVKRPQNALLDNSLRKRLNFRYPFSLADELTKMLTSSF